MSVSHDSAEDNRGKVLFIDDEINVLKSIKRGFLHSDFEVFTAENAKSSLQILEQEDVDIVITDYRMPDIDGLELLKIIKERFPNINRVILSGFIEKSVAIESLTRGLASTYILKPWLNEEVDDKIRHILHMRKILKSKKLLNVINRIENLPTLSNLYTEFIEAVHNDKSMSEISKIIQKDPAVATKVLHIANSAFYGLKNCNSIQQASITLGLDTLQDILLTISIVNPMKWNHHQTNSLQEIITHLFIMNSYLPVLFKMKIGSHHYKNFPSVGLTYDIGKLILLQYYPDRFHSIVAHAEEYPEDGFYKSELALGFHENTHQEIGAFFLDYWNLPEVFVETALFHHCPENSVPENREIAKITNYLDRIISTLWSTEDIDDSELSHLLPDFLSDSSFREMIRSIKKKIIERFPVI
jgi:HD-like signal output (HDOD) protein